MMEIMDRTYMIQYCGPYSIKTSDATIVTQSVESINMFIERAQLLELEQHVEPDLQMTDSE